MVLPPAEYWGLDPVFRGYAKMDLPPAEYWGLDPVFRGYAKMYITDILTMDEVDGCRGVYQYGGHPVWKVDILGTVVRVEQRAKFAVYTVDDGTGVVSCTCWRPEEPDDSAILDLMKEVKGSLGSELAAKVKDIGKVKESQNALFHLGDVLHLRGKLKVFRGMREVHVSFHDKVDDPMVEVSRMVELPQIYRSCYDKPLPLPKKVQDTMGDGSSMFSPYELQAAILRHLQQHSIISFTCEEMWEIAEVATEAAKRTALAEGVVTTGVHILEQQGYIFRQAVDKHTYYVVAQCSELQQIVLETIRTASKKNAESGCSVAVLLERLHSSLQFSAVNRKALLHCLQTLEQQSDIFSTSDNHFLVIK